MALLVRLAHQHERRLVTSSHNLLWLALAGRVEAVMTLALRQTEVTAALVVVVVALALVLVEQAAEAAMALSLFGLGEMT